MLRPLASALLKWRDQHARDLPWRKNRDPYRVWVSEIMLQQTRVETVLPYYEQFLKQFPNVESLAEASEADLLASWSGLGYYRRARLMQKAAREIAYEFPKTYEGLRALPGIGDYTAGAIASIAFGLPYAALDGNLIRVLARLDADDRDIAKPATRRAFEDRAQGLVEAAGASRYGHLNEALMDLGATVCTPKSPKCLICPLARFCKARKQGLQQELPVKSKKARTVNVQLAVAIVQRGESLLMRRRPPDSEVMPGFWELPQAEGTGELERLGIHCVETIGGFKHAITYRAIAAQAYRARLQGERPAGHRWITAARRQRLPVTTITKKSLKAAGVQ